LFLIQFLPASWLQIKPTLIYISAQRGFLALSFTIRMLPHMTWLDDRSRRGVKSVVGALALAATAQSAPAASVLMISVDGMKPEYVLQADAHGLKIPFLRSMVRDGTYAAGVTGVWPTVTYPSHTTLLTGVAPAEHGILNNVLFDPRRTFGGDWYWYAGEIKVRTLWQAAHEAGLSTASVGWPVSVGATAVDTLIPEYWRSSRSAADVDPADTELLAALSRPDTLLAELKPRLGPYMAGNDPGPAGDVIKTRYALEILQSRKPAFMTIHLSALDEEEHAHGPFSAEANAELEVLDADLAQLFAAARTNDPNAVAVVVSDHGFTRVTRRLNLLPEFVRAGLIETTVDPQSHATNIVSWKAQPWPGGGMAAVVLQPSADAEVEQQVRGLLQSLKADERNGIDAILERDAIKQRGGFPDAAFLIVMKLGFAVTADPTVELLTELHGTPGSHGFSPQFPEMRASFFMAGPGIARHRDLGLIDMRQIAPTVAQLLDVKLPAAGLAPLPVRQ
jgi:predicted AlkP superfamily pyrophosphatase or phosphodiesterase